MTKKTYLQVGLNDIESARPDLALKWSPKNPKLPSEHHIGSGKRVLWVNICGHEWQAEIRIEARRNISHCPKCPTPKRKGHALTWAQLKDEYSFKNLKILERVNPISSTLKIWNCLKCHNEYKKSIPKRLQGYGCIPCSNRGLPLDKTHPLLEQYWSLKNKKTFAEYSKSATDKIYWKCKTCSGEWKSQITVQARKRAKEYCPYCSNHRTLKNYNDLQTTHPELALEWSLENSKASSEVRANESHSALWLASCGHEWEARIYDRANKNSKCPYCSNQKLLNGFNDVSTLKPFVLAFWSSDNLLKPNDIKASDSVNKILLTCIKNHKWHSHMSHLTDPVICRTCSGRATSRAEQAIFDYISDLGIESERFNRTLLKDKEIDIYLPFHNIAIEYNGFYWHSEKMGKDSLYHFNKWNECNKKGLGFIQIWEDEWSDKDHPLRLFLLDLASGREIMLSSKALYKTDDIEAVVENGSVMSLWYKYSGFMAIETLPPDYFFAKNGKRYNRTHFSHPSWDEKTIESKGFMKIWDAGKTRWVKQIQEVE